MDERLFPYVQRELRFLRQMLAEFAAQHPEIASGLCQDPHVERLLQGFALLAARIHARLDDEFPEITEGFLNILYPHYLAPVPAMSIAQFEPDPGQGKLTTGYDIPPNAMITAKQEVRGVTCRFQTCYPVTLWPLSIISARLDDPETPAPALQTQPAAAILTLTLHCTEGLAFADLRVKHLRFYLHGHADLTSFLYEALFRHTFQVQLRTPVGQQPHQTICLSRHCLRPVGFGRDEGMLPYAPLSFLGDRLLQEYFTFPKKFLFFDLYEIDRAAHAGCRDEVEIRFLLRQKPPVDYPISAENFQLGCTPIVNLFKQRAKPIRLDHRQSAYPVVPDMTPSDGAEVYSVDEVTSVSSYREEPVRFVPFYSFKHASARKRQKTFWYATRQGSPRHVDAGTDVSLALVDLDFQPAVPDIDTLIVKTTCTNRDQTRELHLGGRGGDFELEGARGMATIRALEPYTDPVRLPLRQSLRWRLIAHLALNYVSVYDAGLEALQEVLTLHDFSETNQRQIEGMTALRRQQVVRRLASMGGQSFCNGTEVTIQFDEEQYAGGELFLFASVLEHFLGLSAPVNSFSQLVITTDQRVAQKREPLNIWRPRAGEQTLW